jgi:hypothetical protein
MQGKLARLTQSIVAPTKFCMLCTGPAHRVYPDLGADPNPVTMQLSFQQQRLAGPATARAQQPQQRVLVGNAFQPKCPVPQRVRATSGLNVVWR